MSSFLGAGQAGVGMVCLAANVAVSFATTTPTAICTPQQRCVPLFLVVRNGGTIGTSDTQAYSLGLTTALSSMLSATTVSDMAATAMLLSNLFTTATTNATQPVAAGAVIYFTSTVIGAGNTGGFVDLVGYLLP